MSNKDQKNEQQQPKGTEVTAKNNTDVMVVDFGEDSGAGMENVSKDEVKIPLLAILQSNSPQVSEPVGQGGVPGAKAGMIINGATGEMYDGEKGLDFLPVFRDHKFLEFTPRNLGGGFVGMYEPNDPKVLKLRADQGKFGKLWTGTKRDEKGDPLDGTEIVETFSIFGLFITPEGQVFRAILPLKSTQIGKYQTFVTRATSIKYPNKAGVMTLPPLWAHKWHLSTVYETKKKGKFYGVSLTLFAKDAQGRELPPMKSLMRMDDPFYTEARAFYDLLKEGKAQADYATDKAGASGDGADDEVPM